MHRTACLPNPGPKEAHPEAFPLRESSQTLGAETTLCTGHVWTQERLVAMPQLGNLSWVLVSTYMACQKVPDVGPKGSFATSRSGFSNFF